MKPLPPRRPAAPATKPTAVLPPSLESEIRARVAKAVDDALARVEAPRAGSFAGIDLAVPAHAEALDKAARVYARAHGATYWQSIRTLTRAPGGAR